MPHIDLLQSQKNEVFKMIRGCGLDPINFEWHEYSPGSHLGTTVPLLSYAGTEYFFAFDVSRRVHNAIFSLGTDRLVEEVESPGWSDQYASVSRWLDCLKRELNEPDLWNSVSQYQLPDGTAVDPSVQNGPFTIPEANQLTEGIKEMRRYLEDEFDGGEDGRKLINEKLDYLVEAVARQGRKDWFYTAMGVVLTLAAELALRSDQARQLWAFLKNAVAGIVKLLPG